MSTNVNIGGWVVKIGQKLVNVVIEFPLTTLTLHTAHWIVTIEG